MVNVGIIGLGFVGNAMYESFLNKNISAKGFDKYKELGEKNISSLFNSDILFLALPTKFNKSDFTYELTEIINTCQLLDENNFKGIIVIKSTVLPGTTQDLSNKFSKLNFIHNPEFLSAKTAYEDFHNQKHIVLGKTNNCNLDKYNILFDFYKENYEAEISEASSDESEMMKCFANSFYAVKVQFFTEMYLACEEKNCDFNNIRDMILKNGWVNPMHTNVPGSDGKISYGGFCFPKDTQALNNYLKNNNIKNKVLDATIIERDEIRNDNENLI